MSQAGPESLATKEPGIDIETVRSLLPFFNAGSMSHTADADRV
jgi:hypothetical protein